MGMRRSRLGAPSHPLSLAMLMVCLFPTPAAGPPRFKQRSFAEMFCKLFLTRLFLGLH